MSESKKEIVSAIENLLLDGWEENQKEIIILMINHQVSIPKIISNEIKRPEGARQEIFKRICELTGYSFDQLPIKKTRRSDLKSKYPNICEGCSDRFKKWTEMFKKINEEISSARISNAFA